MTNFNKYINQPYPFYYKGFKLFQISWVILFLAFFFNYLIQPFEINYTELKFSFVWIALIHSLTPLLVLIPISIVITNLNFETENWSLKNEIFVILIITFFTGVLQFLLRDVIYKNDLNRSWFYFKEELVNTFLIGFIIALLIILMNLNIQFYLNSERALFLNQNMNDKSELIQNQELEIETELKSENFSLQIQDFVYAKSHGNYVELWIHNGKSIQSVLKRMKLKDLEVQLQSFNLILRTHRSFLINKQFIEFVTGNAQGYKISLKECDEKIPVSRNYLELFNDSL